MNAKTVCFYFVSWKPRERTTGQKKADRSQFRKSLFINDGLQTADMSQPAMPPLNAFALRNIPLKLRTLDCKDDNNDDDHMATNPQQQQQRSRTDNNSETNSIRLHVRPVPT